jgi:hypothetical protein
VEDTTNLAVREGTLTALIGEGLDWQGENDYDHRPSGNVGVQVRDGWPEHNG